MNGTHTHGIEDKNTQVKKKKKKKTKERGEQLVFCFDPSGHQLERDHSLSAETPAACCVSRSRVRSTCASFP